MPSSHHSALARVSPRTLGRGNPIERNATPGHIEHTEVERIYDRCMDYPGSDNWADSVVRLAFYKDGGNTDTAGMGGSDGRLDRWWILERHCKPFRHHSVSINTTLHLALAIGLLLGLSFISIVGGKRSEV